MARHNRQNGTLARSESSSDAESCSDERPRKRPRISRQTSSDPEERVIEVKDEIEVRVDSITVQTSLPTPSESSSATKEEDEIIVCTPQLKRPVCLEQQATSPLSSPPPEDFLNPPSAFRNPVHSRVADVALQLSSSPLSSPPPVLFDPFSASLSDGSPSRRSSTSASELDEPVWSQSSATGKSALPYMKGKDLFDASIWSDPLRTSVFYTFATSLRQKIKEVEPTTSHRFISHLRDRGKLVRCYTQNIDQIEEKVGLSTSLKDGPGNKGRFSRRSTANTAQLSKMVDETNADGNDSANDKPDQAGNEASQVSEPPFDESQAMEPPKPSQNTRRSPPPRSGVECVFLHGSLELLRCFLCGRVCSWEDSNRELETLSGQQPECPHCAGATAAREEKGKRALGVGKLRPDIVLYGEEHPNAHLISPIVTHDLSLYPDLLLILGTSLRVHGLKVMVREFAKTVHSKNGKVVFVNFSKPPESSWGEIIDYWIEWDCDAWVDDLQARIPNLWQEPEPPRPRKKRESAGQDDGGKQETKRPPAANPVALRDHRANGAHMTSRVLRELHRITGTEVPDRRASIPSAIADVSIKVAVDLQQKTAKEKPKRPRKSAPGALERSRKASSVLNPNHGRSRKASEEKEATVTEPAVETSVTPKFDAAVEVEETGSILNSVKHQPRVRKRKKIDGEEVEMPKVGTRRGSFKSENTLPPFVPQPPVQITSPFGRPPQPLEPRSPPPGPMMSLSPNIRSGRAFNRPHSFCLDDPIARGEARRGLYPDAYYHYQQPQKPQSLAFLGRMAKEKLSTIVVQPWPQEAGNEQLLNFGSKWNCGGRSRR